LPPCRGRAVTGTKVIEGGADARYCPGSDSRRNVTDPQGLGRPK
jgi:hypothetical protein